MTSLEKTKIILESLDEVIQIDWNREDKFAKAICKALKEIEKKEASYVK